MTRIPKATRLRIESAVKRVERMSIGVKGGGSFGGAQPGGLHQVLLVATQDIEHNAIGTCKIATGAPTTLAVDSADTARQVLNLRQKIWSGSLLLATWASWKSTVDSNVWMVTHAWSATIARGTASATIATGETKTLNAVVYADGTGPTTVQAYNPGGEVANGASVIANLVYNATTGISRWEIVTPAATGSGGGSDWDFAWWRVQSSTSPSIPASGTSIANISISGGTVPSVPSSLFTVEGLSTERVMQGQATNGYICGTLSLIARGTSDGQGPVKLEMQSSISNGPWLTDSGTVIRMPYLRATDSTSSFGVFTALNSTVRLRFQLTNESAGTVQYAVRLVGFQF